MSDSKACARCGIVKPSTADFFHRQGSEKVCRVCVDLRKAETRLLGSRRERMKAERRVNFDTPETYSGISGVRQIPLDGSRGAGKFALVDESHYYLLREFKWYMNQDGYVRRARSLANPEVRLHRVVMDAKVGEIIDHINHDKTDNRTSNLRVCTNAQNIQNAVKADRNASSKYKGVYKAPDGFHARIKHDKKDVFLGYFKDEIKAAEAYDAAANFLFGEYANPNFQGVEARSIEAIREESKPERFKGLLGVIFHKPSGLWQAKVSGNYIGTFRSEMEAYEATQLAYLS